MSYTHGLGKVIGNSFEDCLRCKHSKAFHGPNGCSECECKETPETIHEQQKRQKIENVRKEFPELN
jgi:hypothetical protein